MEKQERHSQFERIDDFNPVVKCDNPIQEKWVHKQVVKKTGDTEDDFIIEEKPVLIESVDIDKSIQEEAKTTDLKYLLKQLMITGDSSVLDRKPGFYGDVSMFDEGHSLSARQKIDLESIKAQLPKDLIEGLTDEEIAKLSEEDIVKFYEAKIAEVKAKQEKSKEEVKPEVKEEVIEPIQKLFILNLLLLISTVEGL